MWLGLTVSISDQQRLSSAAAPALNRPLRLAVYGDSFGQRSQDILGSPNSVDSGAVNPVSKKWATDLTVRAGGVQWGFGPWLDMLSGGKYLVPYHLNRAIGGLNTGQLSQDGVSGDYLGELDVFLAAQLSGPLAPDAVLFQAGTNDAVTTFDALQSYNNIRAICQKIVARGVPVVLSTILPRGTAANPEARIEADRIGVTGDLNNLLISNLMAEPSLAGLATLIDPRASFRDLAGQTNDILPELVYDGLHLSVTGCRLLGQAYIAGLNTRFTAPITDHLPTAPTYIANGLMAGTGGTVTRTGNSTTNQDFAMTGTAPTGWTVTTTLNSGASAWNATHPNNIKGSVVVSKAAADVGEAVVITIDCDASGNLNSNTRAIEAFCSVALPNTTELPVGAYFRGLTVVELTRRSGLPIKGIRGVSAEMRITEPDAIQRVTRSAGPAPNGTANMELADFAHVGATRIVIQTPPRIRKAGAYGTIEFAVVLLVAGLAPDIDVVCKISQAGVKALV